MGSVPPVEASELANRGSLFFTRPTLFSYIAKREWLDTMAAELFDVIASGKVKTNIRQRYALKEQDGILNPDHIADAYWILHQQPRDAWTHELDLRPWMEKMA